MTIFCRNKLYNKCTPKHTCIVKVGLMVFQHKALYSLTLGYQRCFKMGILTQSKWRNTQIASDSK